LYTGPLFPGIFNGKYGR